MTRFTVSSRYLVRGALLAAVCAGAPLRAQAPARPSAPPPLVDNSFLLEEAYNQGARVVQHIFNFEHQAFGRGWALAFEQEWPAPSLKHQLSYDIDFAHTDAGRDLRPGDLGVNYRYQLRGGEDDSRVSVAPRLSLMLTTGRPSEGTGRGGMGYGVGLPVSVMATPRLALHTNVGMTVFPHVEESTGVSGRGAEFSAGQSAIWFASPTVHLMLEGVWTREWTNLDLIGAASNDVTESSFILSPGVRRAFNLRSGTQIVPGIAFPVEMIGVDAKKPGMFLYLSVEHGF